MSSTKHPWELNQQAHYSKATKEEFEALLAKMKKREDDKKSDVFTKTESKRADKPKASPYREIKGIPHKLVNGHWVPLKKL